MHFSLLSICLSAWDLILFHSSTMNIYLPLYLPIYFECHQHTVRKTIRRWEERGLGGLWEASGRGAKARCQAEDIQYVEELWVQSNRTYNSTQLVSQLKQERGVDLSSDRLRRLLKKSGWNRAEETSACVSPSRLSMETHTHQSPLRNKIQLEEQSNKQI